MPLLKHTKTMKKFGDLKNGDKLYITDPTGKTEICPILSVIAEKRDVFPWVHIAYADSNLNVKCFSVYAERTAQSQSVNGILLTFSSCEEQLRWYYEKEISQLAEKLEGRKHNFKGLLKTVL